MHDPYTQVFSFRDLFTIWHVDPEGRGPWQRIRRWFGLAVRSGENSCDWHGSSRYLNAKERALWEAIDDLEHKLGNPPYYPDLYPEREIRALRKAENAWQRRSRWRLHPRWHIWHWSITFYPFLHLKRWLFSRCSICGGAFKYGEAPCSGSWYGSGPSWFRGEPNIYHGGCSASVDKPTLP